MLPLTKLKRKREIDVQIFQSMRKILGFIVTKDMRQSTERLGGKEILIMTKTIRTAVFVVDQSVTQSKVMLLVKMQMKDVTTTVVQNVSKDRFRLNFKKELRAESFTPLLTKQRLNQGAVKPGTVIICNLCKIVNKEIWGGYFTCDENCDYDVCKKCFQD